MAPFSRVNGILGLRIRTGLSKVWVLTFKVLGT